jgi:hypothetical protein
VRGIDRRPADAESAADLVALLNEVRTEAGLSFRDISRRSRAAGFPLPATTVWDMLSKTSLPKVDILRAYLTACGVGAAEVEQWLAGLAPSSRQARSAEVGQPAPRMSARSADRIPRRRAVPAGQGVRRSEAAVVRPARR